MTTSVGQHTLDKSLLYANIPRRLRLPGIWGFSAYYEMEFPWFVGRSVVVNCHIHTYIPMHLKIFLNVRKTVSS